ncbi:MAG: PQQ-binding-like beta-propeller repeat protein [Verrucomicrobiota bacterium]
MRLFMQIICALWIAQSLHAEDWPMWGRDETRNMVSTTAKDLPVTFDAGKKKSGSEEIDLTTTKGVKWVAKVGSQTYGNPSVAGGKVFVGTNNESPRDPKIKGDHGIVMCFDEKTGEYLWQLAVPKLGAGKVSDWEFIGICSSPAVEGNRAYLITNRGEVACLDVDGMKNGNDGPYKDEGKYMAGPGKEPLQVGDKDADIIWLYDMRDDLGVFPHNVSSCSPLIIDDTVFTATSNGMDWSHTNIPAPEAPSFISLDKKTGELLGEEASGVSKRILHCNWSSPAYGKVNGKDMIFWGGGDGWLYSFSTETEKDEDDFDVFKEYWRFDCNPPGYREKDGEPIRYATFNGPSECISTAIYYEGLVYMAIGQDPEHGDGIGAISCIDPSLEGTIPYEKAKWVNKTVARTVSTPSAADGLIYITEYAGKIHCLDAKTGETQWVYDSKARVWGSTLVADGKVYQGTEEGDLIVLQAGKEMKLLGKTHVGAPIYNSPIVANGVLYICSQTHLYAVGK